MTTHFLSQRKNRAHFIKGLISFGELIVTYCENDAERLNTICEQNAELQNITAWGIYVIIIKISSINVMISVAKLH